MLHRNSHSVSDLNYHFVFVPKYRKEVLVGGVKTRVKKEIQRICKDHDFKIMTLDLEPDHLHLFINVDPSWSPAKIARTLKSTTAREVFRNFPFLKDEEYWGDEFWSDSYYVGSAGHITSKTIKKNVNRVEEL